MRKIFILFVFLFSLNLLQAQNDGFKWLRGIHYEMIHTYSDGLAAFMQEGKWGFLNTVGDVVITPMYEEVGDFHQGMARAKLNGKWGVIDKTGNPVFNFTFSELSEFADGMALAKEGAKTFYITPNGKRQTLSDKLEYTSFHEGYARVRDKEKDKWGYINTKGIFVVEPRYQTASDFSNGLALVTRGKETFYINPKGNQKTTPLTTFQPLEFKEGIAKVKEGNSTRFINANLEMLPIYAADASDFNEGMAAVLLEDGSMAYVNTKGSVALRVDYDKVGNFSEGKAWVCKKGKYGYINRQGELIIDTIFTSATDFKNGLAYVGEGNRLGVIKVKEDSDLFPGLELKNLTLKDNSGNNQVEAEESFELAVTLRNKGNEPLYDIDVAMAGKEDQQKWFDFDQTSILCPVLAPHTDTIITFKGKAKLELLSEEIKIEFKGSADNLFSAVTAPYEFASMGINACKPLMAKYWVYKSNHTPLQPGDEVNLKITVTNEGKDLAKAVKVNLLWPEGMYGDEDILKIPVLKPGETQVITTSFTLDSTLANNNFTIVANLSEYTQKHQDIKYLSFESGKMNSEINLMTGSMIYQYPAQNQMVAANPPATPQVAAAGGQLGKSSELLEGLKLVNAPNPDKYALVIGNEDYNSFKQTVSYELNVDYAAQDATAFAAYAKDYLGVPEQNVILLKNATYAQMNFNINKLIMMSKTNPGKVELYVYYAGHGQHDVDSKETYLIPVDVSISAPTAGIKLEKIYADLSASGSKRTMVFLDACYSGVGRGIVIKPKEAPVKGNLLVLTASSSTQRSMPYQEKRHGMFTYFLLKTLRESDGKISVENLYQKVKENVQKNSIWINNTEQTPELIQGAGIEGDWKSWTLY